MNMKQMKGVCNNLQHTVTAKVCFRISQLLLGTKMQCSVWVLGGDPRLTRSTVVMVVILPVAPDIIIAAE